MLGYIVTRAYLCAEFWKTRFKPLRAKQYKAYDQVISDSQ